MQTVREILINITKMARQVNLSKVSNPQNILSVFDDIIPNEYFGIKAHRKIFYNVISKILTRSQHQCIYLNSFAVGYDHTKVPWLISLHHDRHRCMLYIVKVNRWLTDNVVKPLILRYFYFIRTREGNKLDLVSKRLWQSYQAKVFRRSLITGYLTCNQRLLLLEEDHLIKSRGFLKFYPKKSYHKQEFRPIVNIFKTK